jgi:hypothetical protein
MIIQLPLSSDPVQTFITQLGSAKYQFDVRWNDRSSLWVLDISDPSSQTPIASGLALVLGADLLLPYSLGIGELIVIDETGTHTPATVDSLGSSVNVYWLSPDELP